MKLTLKASLVLFLVMAFTFVQAQNSLTISGKIVDSQQQPIDGATVYLYVATDSIPLKTALLTADGRYQFENLKAGIYRISVGMIGFQSYKSEPFTLNNTFALPVIILQQKGTILQEVKVSGQKALVEQKIDRTVINVDAMISNAGSTLLEVLEKSPGVSVDQSGAVNLKGKGATIFIDDKPTYLSGADLENYLRSISSSTVEKIELMPNPPAQYDAAGSGGVINVRTKKSKTNGFNGGVNLSYIQGKYGRTNNSFNFNYRQNKLNLFGNLSYNNSNGFSNLDINRHFEDENGQVVSNFLQNSFIRSTGKNYNSKIGLDYYASDQTTIGIGFTGLYNPSDRKSLVDSKFSDALNHPDSTVAANNNEKNSFKNTGVNLNYRHKFDQDGREISIDADELNYSYNSNQSFNNNSYLPDGALVNNGMLTGQLPTHIHIYSAKADYNHPLKNGFKLGAGLKTSYTQTDNIADYFNTVDAVTLPDYSKTNHFIYKENINAAYLNANKDFKRLAVQAGLRVENTISNGHQLGNIEKADSSFKQNYTSLFPTLYLQYKLDTAGNHLLGFNYGRRIERPNYHDLNPFLSPLDQFTYYTGNPFLKPSYTNSIELSHTYKNRITTTLSYSKTHNEVMETIEILQNIYYSRPSNLGNTAVKSASVDASFDPAKWLNFHLYGEVTNIHTISSFYTGLLDTKGTFFYIKPILQFKLDQEWNIQLDGYYQSKVTNGQFIASARERVNTAVSKKLSAHTTIKLVINDLFYSYVNSGVINNLAQTKADYHNVSDTRTGVVSLSYRFGKALTNVRKHEANGADEEKSRVNN